MEQHKQELIWTNWIEQTELLSKGTFEIIHISQKPYRVWTLPEFDINNKPKLPYYPKHNENAFLEDHLHDWIFQNGKLKYYTRVTATSHWILIEYK